MRFLATLLSFLALIHLSTTCLIIYGTGARNHVDYGWILDNQVQVCTDNGHGGYWDCLNDHYAWVSEDYTQLHYAAHGDNFVIDLETWNYYNQGYLQYVVFSAEAFC
jgi:hypothetical protein